MKLNTVPLVVTFGIALGLAAPATEATDASFVTDIVPKDGEPPVNQLITRVPDTAFRVTTQSPPLVGSVGIAKDSELPISVSFIASPAGLEIRQFGCEALMKTSGAGCRLYVNPLTAQPGSYTITEYVSYGSSQGAIRSLPAITVKKVRARPYKPARLLKTTTPIRHLVVIFDENNSFDRYFGTYPYATNRNGTPFTAKAGTPIPDNFLAGFATNGTPLFKDRLVGRNPNLIQPYRLAPDDYICTNDHEYAAELEALNWPALTMDRVVEHATHKSTAKIPGTDRYWNEFCQNPSDTLNPRPLPGGQAMGYFDGNAVTALWNYAQNFAMSDHFHQTTYGPSTLGHLTLAAGTTGPVFTNPVVHALPELVQNGYLVNDMWALFDECSFSGGLEQTLDSGAIEATTVGDLLNRKGVSWGWFAVGFAPSGSSGYGMAGCGTAHADRYGVTSIDYSTGNEPFQFFASTANPRHLPPSATRMIGSQDQANHQYDIASFDRALKARKLPAVSFLKPRLSQSGHGDFSNPLDEQAWLVETLNKIQRYPDWKHTAVIITYDDSDGDYDHVPPPGRPGDGPVG